MNSELKILLVDDNQAKRLHVQTVLEKNLSGHELQLSHASNYEECLLAMAETFFDVVVLDLVLPAAGNLSSQNSRTLIHMVLAGNLVAPTHLIGLTEYADIADNERAFYDQHLFSLEFYNRESEAWGERIVNRIRYLLKSKHASISLHTRSYNFDLVVISARHDTEYKPIRKQLLKSQWSKSHPLWNGAEASFGKIDVTDATKLTTAIVCVGEMGLAPAAAVTSQAILTLRPRLIVMLGMCCGFAIEECASPRKMGDLIIAREAACWEEGKFVQSGPEEKFHNRAKVRVVDDTIRPHLESISEQAEDFLAPTLRTLGRNTGFKTLREKFPDDTRTLPEARLGLLVSGSSVVADEKKVRSILKRHSSAVGLDMEMYGFFTAVDRAQGAKPCFFGVKGVADFGDGTKGDAAQQFASRASAEVFLALLRGLPANWFAGR